MKPIYIFRHQEYEGPGYLQQVLHQHQLPYQIFYIDQGETVPSNIEHCSALVFMGGPMSVNDELPWIAPELHLIRDAVAKHLPVLGHCLGGQLISKALGGKITANAVKEIGWLPVIKSDNNECRSWLGELPDTFEVFHWHGETFSIPEGAVNILHSVDCAHQAFVIDNTLAMQCHIEMTPEMVQQWTHCYTDELISGVATIQSKEQMEKDLQEKTQSLQNAAEKIYKRWLQPLL